MPLSGSLESVVAAIRDDAAVETERVEKAAADEVASVRAAIERVPAVAPDREQRVAAARRRTAEALAQAEWEARRAFIEQRERWIEAVVRRGREILQQSPAEVTERLTAEARAAVGDSQAEVIGSCIVRAGNLVVDNSFDERARRFEPLWRAALAERYRA